MSPKTDSRAYADTAAPAEGAGGGADAAQRRPLFEVERERRWRVWLLFGLLVLVALIPLIVLGLIVGLVLLSTGSAFSVFTTGLRWYHVAPTIAVAVVGAAIYWYAAQRDARRRLLAAMGGRPLDPHDRYHQRLANVVEELRLASGHPQVEAVVVPSYGLNAFAFSDLREGSVIGVSEGAISGLSRQQLQAVVAHEFAHVLSGSNVTVTLACLLFGMWDGIGRTLDSVGERLRDQDRALADGGVHAGSALMWLAETAGSIVNGALSRQREFRADLAAVRYTRDPMSLALALRAFAEHPVGRGYVPPGLAALCIIGKSADHQTRLQRMEASHPPVDERIDALLMLANTGRRELQEQAELLDETLGRREHFRSAPGTQAAPVLQTAQRAALAGASGPAATSVGALPGAAGGAATAAQAAGGPPTAASTRRAALRPCPACGGLLGVTDYEGVHVPVCPACGGRFIGSGDVARVIARREVRFTPRQQTLAEEIVASGNELRKAVVRARFAPKEGLRPCPRCGRTMVRRHYSYEVAVDVDYCGACEAYWFDHDELEVVQIVAEQRLG